MTQYFRDDVKLHQVNIKLVGRMNSLLEITEKNN